MQLDDDENEAVDDQIDDDESVVVGEIVAGTSGVTVAIPSQSEVPNVKKRKQPAITDFFVKKHINKK